MRKKILWWSFDCSSFFEDMYAPGRGRGVVVLFILVCEGLEARRGRNLDGERLMEW